VSRQLASVVVPHEYGLDGPGKLLIGSKICAELLGKLLCDLDSMKVGGQATGVMLGESHTWIQSLFDGMCHP
jgi:inositol hexakisphosphate/diphosphoinositol-pentakisphosphate kinase